MKRANGEVVEIVILRVLRLARAMAAEDAHKEGTQYPQPYDYLPTELIRKLIDDEDWRTVGYETPSSTIVLRRLWRLERDGQAWTWEGSRHGHRWALANWAAVGRGERSA